MKETVTKTIQHLQTITLENALVPEDTFEGVLARFGEALGIIFLAKIEAENNDQI